MRAERPRRPVRPPAGYVPFEDETTGDTTEIDETIDLVLWNEQSAGAEEIAPSGAFHPIDRLDRDLKEASKRLSPNAVRYLVKQYYGIQEHRIRAYAQMRTSLEMGEPNSLSRFLAENYETLERDIARAMDSYSRSKPEGVWLRSITGIGPVLGAGLMAHISIKHADSPAHIWRFAGLDPTLVWGKGQRRPYNADLKALCWKIRQSFVKSSGSSHSEYGQTYRDRKAYEIERNERGGNREAAAAQLQQKHYGEETVARSYYVRGMLPPAHIQARAERYTVKLFLSHYWSVLWDIHRSNEPKPLPYPIAVLGHKDYVAPPHWVDSGSQW